MYCSPFEMLTKMPFAFEVLILPQVRESITLQRGKTFCLVPSLRQAFNRPGFSDVGIHLHYSHTKRCRIIAIHVKREKKGHPVPLNQHRAGHLSLEKHESGKSLSVCIINARRVWEVAKNSLKNTDCTSGTYLLLRTIADVWHLHFNRN